MDGDSIQSSLKTTLWNLACEMPSLCKTILLILHKRNTARRLFRTTLLLTSKGMEDSEDSLIKGGGTFETFQNLSRNFIHDNHN